MGTSGLRKIHGTWRRILLGLVAGMTTGWVMAFAAETPIRPPIQTPLVERRLPSEVPILAYHDINLIPSSPWTMSAKQFDEEMAFLAEHQFHPISMNQLYAAIADKTPLPVRPVVITFDDGYDSTYSAAFPTLKNYGYPFTVFMIAGFINRPGFLTLNHLREMQASGLAVIGSHTINHVNLAAVPNDEMQTEVRDSRYSLSEDLKRDVGFFSYPGGQYRTDTVKTVREAGYKLAVTTESGYASLSGNPWTLKRITIHQGVSIQAFENLLSRSLRS